MVAILQVSTADIPRFITLNHACDAEAYGAFEEWMDAERTVMLIENETRTNLERMCSWINGSFSPVQLLAK